MGIRATPRAYPSQPRWPWLLTVVPYVLLAVLVAFRVTDARPPIGVLRIDLALCALAAAWILWMFILHPSWTGRPKVMAVFFTGLVVIMAALILRDPSFGIFALAGYMYAFALLPWPGQLVGVGAVAVLAGTAQASDIPRTTVLDITAHVLIIVVNVLATCGFAWIYHNNGVQSEQRRQAVEELAAANRRLEATFAENEGLHAQLVAQARETGVRDERRRMAREIHDTLAQGLTGIITQLQAAEQAGSGVARDRHVAAATSLARESLSEARRSVDALRPEPLENARLSGALAEVTERWSALHGITATVITTGTVRPLSAEIELALLRTAQEGLANTAKHAQAARVGVTLSYLEHQVALDVRDDGTGFDPAGAGTHTAEFRSPAGGGFGLIAMRQRIEALNGTLQIETEPGAGTGVSACVPIVPIAPVEART